VTRSSLSPTPATRGKTSLSPFGRFGRHSAYRTAQDYLSSRYVAIVDRAAAFAGPRPDGQGEPSADMAAARADTRATREPAVDTPRTPRPFGFIAEGPQEPSKPGVGQRAPKTGSHQAAQAQIFNGKAAVGVDQFPRRLVHRILSCVGEAPMRAGEPGDGATAVRAALATPVALAVQPP